MGNAAADGAAVAHLDIANHCGGVGQGGNMLAHEVG